MEREASMIRLRLLSGLAAAWFARLGRHTGAWLSAGALIAAAGIAPSVAHAQYTAFQIPQPSSGQPGGLLTPVALNNLGQVLIFNIWGSGATQRGAAIYANGTTVGLAFPAGYHVTGYGDGFLLNDTGMAMWVGQMDTATNAGLRPIVWQGGAAHAIPLPMTPADCATQFATLPPPPPAYTQESFNVRAVGPNRVGHILIDACNTLWIVDPTGNVLLQGPPPVVIPQAGQQPAYFEWQYGNHLNDADVVSADTGIVGFPEGTHPGVLTGLSSFAPMPTDFGNVVTINNHDQILVRVQPSGSLVGECLVGTGSAVADLGVCGNASLNNLGQVAFVTTGNLPRLYKDGNIVAITLPPEASTLVFTGWSRGLNDAGQIIGVDNFNTPFLLTPTGACAADVTAQTSVRHAGLRLDATTGHYKTTVHVKNTGSTTLAAPVSVALDGLPATASLVDRSGVTSCDPPAGSVYLDLPVSIAPGRTVTGTLEFIDPSGGRLRYTTRVIAGPGRR
jgi:hypothetical protein